MDFRGSSSRRRKSKKVEITLLQSELYKCGLQMYKIPPVDDITLTEFHELAFERLKVLRLVEQIVLKNGNKSVEAREKFTNELRRNNLRMYLCKPTGEEITAEEYEARRRDHISHFILRLAYCKTESSRRWFLQQECDLFRFRFLGQEGKIHDFLKANQLDYDPINKEEKDDLKTKLSCSGYRLTEMHVLQIPYFKVQFSQVLELVQNRRVYLVGGYAYVPHDDFISVVLNAFRSNLSHALAVTARRLPQLEDDTRLLEMIKGLDKVYLGKNYGIVTNSGEIKKDSIDELSRSSFPLCMRTLHETLRQNHHLRHGGRLQYGLFLKGIGIKLEDAIAFFREEFTRIMDLDKFDKTYVYNIRYNYGKEGKRANYTPYSCSKIILSNPPGHGDYHGCPFKHSDSDHLRNKLKSLNISPSGINEVLDLTSKGHYQLACTRYFELTHKNVNLNQGIDHPNQYFTESRKLLEAKEGAESSSRLTKMPATTRSQMYTSRDQKDFDEMGDVDEASLLLASHDY